MKFDNSQCRCECPECFRDREGTRITLHKKKFNGIGECPYCQEYILNSDIKKCAYCQEVSQKAG